MKRNGFTLIELLVVIAIISLLVSILVPSLTAARDLAKMTVCRSNMHNIGLALHLFAGDNQDTFPMFTTDLYLLKKDWVWCAHGLLYRDNYIQEPSVFYCPMNLWASGPGGFRPGFKIGGDLWNRMWNNDYPEIYCNYEYIGGMYLDPLWNNEPRAKVTDNPSLAIMTEYESCLIRPAPASTGFRQCFIPWRRC